MLAISVHDNQFHEKENLGKGFEQDMKYVITLVLAITVSWILLRHQDRRLRRDIREIVQAVVYAQSVGR